MFTKPFYYGWFEYPKGSGQCYPGKHEPMITEAEYDRVQTLLSNRGNPASANCTWILPSPDSSVAAIAAAWSRQRKSTKSFAATADSNLPTASATLSALQHAD